MNERFRQRKQLHLRDFDYTDCTVVYFITICTADRQPYFLDERIAEIIADEVEFRGGGHEINLFCYCVMPDHVHILLSLTEEYKKSLQNWVATFKRYTSRAVNLLFEIKPLMVS